MKRDRTGITLAAALRELGIVHRRDQAFLLREACALACGATPLGRLYVAGGSTRRRGRPAWDRACAEEIASARSDGFPVDPALPRLLELPSARWPRPTVLAEAAQELRPCRAGRVDLARARVAERDAARAIEELRAVLAESPGPTERAPALEALALALECIGDLRAALACYAEAAREPRSATRVSVALLALALRLPDLDGVSLAVERLALLDLSVPGTRRRFDRAVLAARGRAARDARARGRGTQRSGGPILEMALAGSGACSEVARGLP